MIDIFEHTFFFLQGSVFLLNRIYFVIEGIFYSRFVYQLAWSTWSSTGHSDKLPDTLCRLIFKPLSLFGAVHTKLPRTVRQHFFLTKRSTAAALWLHSKSRVQHYVSVHIARSIDIKREAAIFPGNVRVKCDIFHYFRFRFLYWWKLNMQPVSMSSQYFKSNLVFLTTEWFLYIRIYIQQGSHFQFAAIKLPDSVAFPKNRIVHFSNEPTKNKGDQVHGFRCLGHHSSLAGSGGGRVKDHRNLKCNHKISKYD